MTMMQPWLLAVLVAGALAVPINVREISDETTCARRCVGSNKFRYTPGKTYEFDYNVKYDTTMEGSLADRVSLDIRAVADIEVLSQCDFALKLRNINVYDTSTASMRNVDMEGEFRATLEKNTLRFSFQDGVIEDLCPAEDENTWSLNFKRGVLSSIQNSMDNLKKDQMVHETDITGKCNTNYKVSSSGWYSTTIIKKSKDLIGCTDRNGYRSALQATPYRVPSNIQSLPLLKSTHDCEQQLDRSGRITSTLCRESHIFRPFSRENSGAVTKVTQKLNFKQEREGVSTKQGYIGRRATIHFEHAYGQMSSDKTKQDAVSRLEEICAATMQDIRPEVPEMFSQLVYTMKNLDTTSMRQIFYQITQKSICRDNNVKTRKFFLDALPMTGTDASVRMMKELLLNKDVSGYEAEMWITSLAFIQNPTAEMLEEAKALLESTLTSEQALLPVSTMVNNYCSQRPSCESERAVSGIIGTLERNIGPGCYVTDAKLDTVLRTLRALGNAGHVNSVSSILSTCFLRSGNSDEVRVAAVDAYRRLPCTVDRTDVLRLYEDRSQDSELRITAYIAVMQCPSDTTLSIIKRTLENERANQVGSFVWSHLTNLMESSSPHKQGIRQILENDDLKKEFDLEKIKYSRNYEGSLFIEKFNTGAMVESNLIWSGKSFIPRSAMVNLTVDLFGNSMNLFEMGGRVEGLEYLLETYLGPYGYFGDKKGSAKSNAGLDQVRASMYMRMFGNEMAFMHTKGVGSLQSLKNFRFMNLLNKVSTSHNHLFTQSIMFMDSSIIVPTASGLPLNLTVNGTATVDLKAVGTINLKKLTASPSSILIDGEFQPSGSIQMTGIMSVDAFVTKIGMKVINTWHSSTAARGRIELNRGKVLSVELDMPQEKMEILDVRTAFFALNGDSVREQKMLENERKSIKLCSGSRLATITGLEICSEFNYVNASMRDDAPYFPFTGPFSMELALHKRDTHKTYKLLAKRTESSASSIAQLALNTPGSKVDRSLGMDFSMNFKRKFFEIGVTSPWKKITAKGNTMANKNQWAVGASLLLDETREYSVNGEIKFNKQKDKTTYKPRLEIIRPKTSNIILSGLLVTEKNKMADLEMSLVGIQKYPVTLKATGTSSKTDKSLKTSFSLEPKREYAMSASLIHETSNKRASFKFVPSLEIKTPTTELISVSGSADYKEGRSFKGDFTIAADDLLAKPIRGTLVLKHSSSKRSKYTGAVSIKSRLVNAKANGVVDCKSSGTSTRILVDYNIRKITKNRVTFNSKYTDRSTKSLTKYKLTANMEAQENPELNFHTIADLTHGKTNTEASIDFVYGSSHKSDNNRISSSVMVNHQINSKATSVDYNVKARYLPLGVDAQLKGNHKHDNQYLTSSMQYTNGKTTKIKAGLNLKDESKHLMKMSGDFNLGLFGKDISVSTTLNQPSKKQMYHDITWKFGKLKSSIFTKYQQAKGSLHKFSTDIHMSSRSPIKISGSAGMDYRNFKAMGQVLDGDDTYGLKTAYKYSDEPRGKWSFGITHPAREMTIDVNGGKQVEGYDGQIDAKWNVGRNSKDRMLLDGRLNVDASNGVDGSMSLKYPSRKVQMNIRHATGPKYTTHADLSWSPKEQINIDTSINVDLTPASRSLDMTVQLQTPFIMVQKVKAEVGLVDNSRVFTSKVTYSRNGRDDQMTTNFNINKPLTIRNVDITTRTTTSWPVLQQMEMQITHRLDSKLMTKVKGSIDRTNVDLAIFAESRGDANKRDVEASIALKSNIRDYESAALRISHNDDARKYVTDAVFDFNGRQWVYDLDMTHYHYGWQIQNTGKLTVSGPYYKVISTWLQHVGAKDMKSSFTSEWGRGQMVKFDFGGNWDDNRSGLTISNNMHLQTPWMDIRDIEIEMAHEYRLGFLHSSTQINQNRRQKWNSIINFIHSTGQIDFDMNIISPLADDITGKINSRYNRYPMTGHADITWSHGRRMSADGSLDVKSLSNVIGNIRIATPFENAEKFVLQVSQKKEGSEFISTSTIQYGLRKTIEMETRVQLDSNKRLWTKIYTPFEDYKDMEAGIEFSGNFNMFSGKSELTIKPVFGTLSGVANFDWRSDLNAKLRIDTPFVDFPYLQVHAASEVTAKGHNILIESEYSPRQSLSLESSYNFNGPIYFEAKTKSPFENWEQTTVLLRHATGYKSMKSYTEVTYGRDSKVVGDMKLKWDRDLDGRVTLKTPFDGYENNKVTVHHEGDFNDFKCHGEIEMFGDNLIDTDIAFQKGHRTTGSLFISSSHFDKVKAKFATRGDLTNFRTSSSVSYGYKKMLDMQLQNKISSRRLNTALVIKTPYMDNLDVAIANEGNLRRFTTKATGTLGSNKLTSETSFTLIESSVDFSSSLQYMINGYEKHLALSVQNHGDYNDFSATGSAQMDNEQVEMRATFNTRKGLEGKLTIQTPIDNFRETGMSFSHTSDPSSFTSSGQVTYMDGKAITAALKVIGSEIRRVETKAELQTPFQYYENIAFEHRHVVEQDAASSNSEFSYGYNKKITSDVRVELAPVRLNIDVKTPFSGYETSRVIHSHDGNWNRFQSHCEIELALKTLQADTSFTHDSRTDGSIIIKSNMKQLRDARITFRSNDDIKNLEAMASAKLNDVAFEGEVNNRMSARNLVTTVSVTNPFTDKITLNIDHRGTLSNLNSKGSLSWGSQNIEAEATLRTIPSIDGTFTLRTPFRNFRNTGLTIKHNGNLNQFDFDGSVNYMDGESIETKINHSMSGFGQYAYGVRRLVTGVNIKTPFADVIALRLDHNDADSDYNTASTVSYGNNDINVVFRYKLRDASIQITTPFQQFRDISASGKFSGDLNQFNTEGQVRYMDDRTITGKISGSIVTPQNIETSIEVQTPFMGFEQTMLKYRHNLNEDSFAVNTELQSNNEQKVLLDIKGTSNENPSLNAVLKTPINGYKHSQLIMNCECTTGLHKGHMQVDFAGKSANLNGEFINRDTRTGRVVLTTTIEGVESMEATFTLSGELSDFKINAAAALNDKKVESEISNRFGRRHLVTSVVVKTPVTDDIVVNLSHNGRSSGFSCKASASIKRDVHGSFSAVYSNRETAVKLDADADYTMYQHRNRASLKIASEGSMNDLAVSVKGKLNRKSIEVNTILKAGDDVHGEVTIKTPFSPFRNVGLSFDHSGSLNRFRSEGLIKYMDDKQVSGKINHYNYMWRRIESSMEIKTPISGYEITKGDIRHTADDNTIKCNAGVYYGRGEEITGDINISLQPTFDFTVKAKTPFSGYEEMSAEATYGINFDKYSLDSSINAGNGNKFSVISLLDLSSSPVTASVRISTPFTDLETVDLSITHSGKMPVFESTLSFSCPCTGHIDGGVMMHYMDPFNLNSNIHLTSDIRNIENLKFAVNAVDRADTKRFTTEIAYGQDKEITIENSFKQVDSWNGKLYAAEITITTPYPCLRQTSMKVEHEYSSDKYTGKVQTDINGETILDADMDYAINVRHEASLNMRKPKPMRLTLSSSKADNSIDGDLYVNWNRDEPDSNIRFQTIYNDNSGSYSTAKDLKLKLIHPSRTVGIIGSVSNSPRQTKTQGELIWDEDEGQKLTYDFALNDRSRRYSQMYDGSLKFGLPMRSLRMSGSYGDNSKTKTVDGSFFWDADKDQTKEIGLKAILSPTSMSKTADITLRLPSIGKDVKLGTEMMLNEGRVLFNGKTSFSYSPDSRKTLTLLSKLEDLSSYGSKNYSLVVAISHPYTDVDAKMNSHIGWSSKKYTTHMDMSYLTARRETKNMALRAEIDRLRQQISLKMTSPESQIDVTGNIIDSNPYQLRITSRVDNINDFVTNLKLDTDRRYLEFQTNYDMENPRNTFHVEARYLNDSAVQAVAYRRENFNRIDDSLFTARLNTSRLLHTRIHWRPDIVADFQGFMTRQVQRYGDNAIDKLHQMSSSFGEELEGKYRRITSHISEEARPMVDALATEMEYVGRQLDRVRREARKMHANNDFYLQDMGETFSKALDSYKYAVSSYKTFSRETVAQMLTSLDAMKSYPILEEYQKIVSESVNIIKEYVEQTVSRTVETIALLDDTLRSARKNYHMNSNELSNKIIEYLQSAKDLPLKVKNLKDYIPKMDMADQFTSGIYNVHDMINSGLAGIMNTEDITRVQSLANNVYQEGQWAYNYWQVEENVQKHLKSIFVMVIEMIQEELEHYESYFDILHKSRVIVMDPDHGEIQLEMYLPLPFQSLDSLPEIMPHINKVRDSVNHYIPDKSTVQKYYEDYFPSSIWRSPNKTVKTVWKQDFANYVPGARRNTRRRAMRIRAI